MKRYPWGVLMLAVVLAGCATAKPVAYTGFLADYDKLKPSTEVAGLLVDKSSGHQLSEYKKFMVDPIEIRFAPRSKAVDVDDAQLKELVDYFQVAVVSALSEKFAIVNQPGPGVLRIRAALTDVVPNKPYFNLHWSTTASGIGIGGASLEAEFLDSQTGERVLAVVDTRRGKKLHYFSGLSKWGHTKDVFKQWIELLVMKVNGQTVGSVKEAAALETTEVTTENAETIAAAEPVAMEAVVPVEAAGE